MKSEPITRGRGNKDKKKNIYSLHPVFGLLLHTGNPQASRIQFLFQHILWPKTQVGFSLSSLVTSSSIKRRASGGRHTRLFRPCCFHGPVPCWTALELQSLGRIKTVQPASIYQAPSKTALARSQSAGDPAVNFTLRVNTSKHDIQSLQ